MGYMAYIAFFYILIAEFAMKGENQHFDFSDGYTEGRGTPAQGRSLINPVQQSGRITKFFLYTPEAVTTSLTLDVTNSHSLSHFDPSLGTKIIIHGFLDSASIAPWMHDMKDELLIYDDYNVIIVDWSSGNSIPYSRAATNTEKVGKEISDLLTKLVNEYGAKPETFHLIGHSLGSHVAGFVGETIKGIGRITGLDPAAPRFENKDPNQRLDPSDAIFVDVIHTDARAIGMEEAIGHQDFYPNSGRAQPGCTASNYVRTLIQEGVVEGARSLICSHTRAPLFFTASINNHKCQMTGVLCNSWEEFRDGQCVDCGAGGERCAVMGFHANARKTGRNRFLTYYLVTRSDEPYCAHEYKVTFEVEDNDSSVRRRLRLSNLPVIGGDKTLRLTIYGSHGYSEVEISGDRFDSSSKPVTDIVPSKIYLGNINGAVAEWGPLVKSARVLSAVTGKRFTTPRIRKIEISLVKDSLQSWNLPKSYTLCSIEKTRINEDVTFDSNYC